MSEYDQDVYLKQYAVVVEWVADQNLATSTSSELALPSEWKHLSSAGVIHVASTADGRHCILMKKQIGWKGNFEGLLYCDGPLHANEVIKPSSGVSYITLAGLGIFEELYIRKQYNDQLFEIYFDLN